MIQLLAYQVLKATKEIKVNVVNEVEKELQVCLCVFWFTTNFAWTNKLILYPPPVELQLTITNLTNNDKHLSVLSVLKILLLEFCSELQLNTNTYY